MALKKTYTLLITCIIFTAYTFGQSIGDCIGAIPVCDSIYVVPKLEILNAGDNTKELPTGICMTAENLSIWYSFSPKKSGKLGFNIIPNDADEDYDWVVFDITNKTCADIKNDASLAVSCNNAGGKSFGINCNGTTGANGLSNYTSQGAGCGTNPPNNSSGYTRDNALIPVQAGNQYVLLINKFTKSDEGYTLDFTVGESVGIYDNINPVIEQSVLHAAPCKKEFIDLVYSEPMKINTFKNNDFNIVGPQNTAINFQALNASASNKFASKFRFYFDPPIYISGDYTFTSSDKVTDNCDNPASEINIPFNIVEKQIYKVDIDTTSCEDVIIDITDSDVLAYEWKDGSISASNTISQTGTYLAKAIKECEEIHYTIAFSRVIGPSLELVQLDSVQCFKKGQVSLTSKTGTAPFEYKTANTTFTDSPIIDQLDAKSYSFIIRDANNCLDTLQLKIPKTDKDLYIKDYDIQAEICDQKGSIHVKTVEGLPPYSYGLIPDPLEANSTISNLDAGMYQLVVVDALACSDTIDINIPKESSGLVIQGDTIYTIDPNDTVMFNLSSNLDLNSIIWEGPTSTLSCTDCLKPTATPDSVSQYTITVLDQYGCEQSKTIYIRFTNQYDVYVPNTFTPNNDGINDKLAIYGNPYMKSLTKFQVFDRWGNKVYDYDPSKAVEAQWDGIFRSKPVNNGVYVWQITVLFKDGKQKQFSGTTSVIR